jgi:hypothetical protein
MLFEWLKVICFGGLFGFRFKVIKDDLKTIDIRPNQPLNLIT